MSFLDRFFGPTYEKEIKEIRPLVDEINAMEETICVLSDDSLKDKLARCRERVAIGASLDDVLPEVFALVREASKRVLKLRHYDVQMIGGVILHRGKITEMRTGEGKTLVATLPATLNALTGKGVHIVTVNDYLARRDAVWMGQIYAQLGLTVGVINHESSYLYDPGHTEKDQERDEHGSFKVVYDFLRPCERQEAYKADITYGTNSEFGFDYLRDNIEYEISRLRQPNHSYAIVDEIDSILIDEARTPLIISAPATDVENLYPTFASIAEKLNIEEHFTVDEKLKSVALNDAGIEMAEKLLGIDNIYTDKGIKYVHHLETAVRAKALFVKNKEYVVRDGEVVIVDEFTGRLQPGRRWSEGLHQAVEAKEGVPVQKESKTFASITYQNYFRMYDKLSGMTGTALTSQEEFFTVYNLEVIPVPTNKTTQRNDPNDLIYQNESGKFKAIINKVKSVHETGQPILIGTASIESNERLSEALKKAGVAHEMLNAKNHEREGEIIAAAGIKGAVTLATNMAGRGVDIKLGGPDATKEEAEEIKKLGGLFVLGTERHEARRIDDQLRGRSGRQGDPGETQFYVSMEDSLMRIFGGAKVQGMMGKFKIPEDQPITMSLISSTLDGAQTKIEGFHFDSRKQILAYDDVLNKQRQSIYARRRKLLMADESELEKVTSELFEAVPETEIIFQEKKAEFGEELFMDIFRRLTLQMIDMLWVEHLEVMGYTRSSVSLRAYGQRDPLIEYRKEGNRLFKEMNKFFYLRIAEVLPKIQPQAVVKEEEERKHEAEVAQANAGNVEENTPKKQSPLVKEKKYSRNEIVTITNGTETKEMKFKKAESMLNSGWSIVSK
ncbi:preprotein translocase subunit SecA [Candidatus Kaiserbacteria bacterium]|nr:preprotein translocase subunit SecA [Candidatus Kaiserbacteria bacterium]USN91841.1 MAG: preprotein translocase subunit SecA [Candidatus Nomurabacteria bacterium]